MDPDLLTDTDALLRRSLADLCEQAAAAEPPDPDAKWLAGGWRAAAGPVVPLAMAHFDPLSPRAGAETLWQKLDACLDALARLQHDDGLVDLQTSNFHSPPDTAFMVEELAVLYEVVRGVAEAGPRRADVLDRLRRIISAGCDGIVGGGVHTPNHRWKVASALMLADALGPGDAWRAEADAYLAEGIDIDDDGEFTERSTGCYNEVSDRSLVLLARATGRRHFADLADRNLEHMLHLLHADGTLVTTYSRRQDRHTTVGIERYLHLYWARALAAGNGRFLSAARLGLRRVSAAGGSLGGLALWLRYFRQAAQAPPPDPLPLADEYERRFDGVGVVRLRRGDLSLTLMAGREECLAVRFGDGPEVTVRVATGLAPNGRFLAEPVEGANGRYALRARQRCEYFGPGPDALPAVDWRDRAGFSRRVFVSAELDVELDVEASPAGLRLRLRATGCERVPVEVALLVRDAESVETRGEAEHDDEARKHFLNAGELLLHKPPRVVRVAPGVGEHDLAALPTGGPHPLPGAWCIRPVTPVDLTMTLRVEGG